MAKKYAMLLPVKGGGVMQTFSISKREYKNLQEFELSKVVTNTEGKIYNYQKEHKEKNIKKRL